RSLDQRFPPVDNIPGEPILKVENLTTKFEPILEDISFEVKKGEIFGLYGLVGAGRSELLETLFGLRTIKSGTIKYASKLIEFKSSAEAMSHGFAFVTEERKFNGLFLKSNLIFNTCINNIDAYSSFKVVRNKLMVDATGREIKVMKTKCMGPSDPITSLSGGNQQKIIIGKWLERNPNIFLLDEPTRGIDVGAKYEIYQLIIKMAKEGKTCIVVSSEMPEILGITNRIAVMSNHKLSGIVNTKDTNQEELLKLSARYL
ncbi:MAG: ATP-binding cassette domain-containing protein, partial [Bacilli bacterium]